MNLTNEQIDSIFATADAARRSAQNVIDEREITSSRLTGDRPARRAMIHKIIEGYLAIAPQPAPQPAVRWIPAVNRKPTDGDFSTSGHVVILRSNNTCLACHSDNIAREGADYYWMSISTLKSAPKEPINPEAVEESEFNTWWTANCVSIGYNSCLKGIAQSAWKAARKNKIP